VLGTLGLSLMVATAIPCATKRTFQAGKLINITEKEETFNGTSLRRAIFIVQIGDLIYTAKGGIIRPHAGDVGQGLIIGDAVQAAVDGEDLILLKPDGKELRIKITKRERVVAPRPG
jgi:hypothetical protein